MDKLLSIVVPVYDVEEYICACIDSILQQSYANFELILVDDGSKDRSGCICDEYASKDSRVFVIHKENEGVSVARNEGLRAAKGEYIAFADSDDTVEKNIYQFLIALIEHEHVDSACCSYFNLYAENKIKANAKFQGMRKGDDAFEIMLKDPAYTVSIWNKIFKRDAILSEGKIIPFKNGVTMGEDEQWLAQVMCNSRTTMIFVKKPLYNWRMRENSATHIRTEKVTHQQEDGIKILLELSEFAHEHSNRRIEKLLRKRLAVLSFNISKECYQRKNWDDFYTYYSIYNNIPEKCTVINKSVYNICWFIMLSCRYNSRKWGGETG